MTTRLMLVAPGVGAELRDARFGADGEPELAEFRGAPGLLPAAVRAWAGPSRRCAATAEALGLAADLDPRLGDLDHGRWQGRTLDEVAASEPAALAQWLGDPAAAPHGGESVVRLCDRVGDWLAGLPDGRVAAVVEPAVVRAALVAALALPPELFWRLDVAPLTVTELTGRLGRWNLRTGRALTAST